MIRLGSGPLGGSVFNNVGATPGNPNAAAIDAIFTDNGQPFLTGYEEILEDLAALKVSGGNLTG